MNEKGIEHFFSKIIAREDYDLNSQDGCKDIRRVKGDVIIDDNPEQAVFARKFSYHAFVVKPFTSSRMVSSDEFDSLHKRISKLNGGFFKKLFG